jgi:hypothetical protein
VIGMAIRRTTVCLLSAIVAFFGAACQSEHGPVDRLVESPVVYVQHSPGWQLIDWMGKSQGLIGSDHVGIPYQSPGPHRALPR